MRPSPVAQLERDVIVAPFFAARRAAHKNQGTNIMKAWEIQSADGIDALTLADRPDPAPGPGQVRVKVRASLLNYRDLMTVIDPVSRAIAYPRIPNSDGAGEITAVGDGVESVKVGDRVAGSFFQRWPGGKITPDAMASALGGGLDGMMASDALLAAGGVVKIPDHLSFEEAATLPCAALTAWNGLVTQGGVQAGETVLIIGTGGVSIFALQFAKMHGAVPIVISSSDEKLARAAAMGAAQTINYREFPDWDAKVLEATEGRGVDHVVEVGGAGTLEKSLNAIAVAGKIAVIGVLAKGAANTQMINRKSVSLTGIYVGNNEMFDAMNRAIASHQMKPVVDRVFDFEDARAAYHCMRDAGHFGKIVVRAPE
ncbi:MAG: NADPH:quinone reductase-like Zn-dependent oxidoreductase [Alphaproteobacteria bacterium]|jgi:NADPH:quinone reductase-like Zn-dependent oxidoreductase